MEIPEAKRSQRTPVKAIQPKRNPPSFAEKYAVTVDEKNLLERQNLLVLWKSMRYLASEDQLHPRFVGWLTLLFKKIGSKETRMTYLPPIKLPITECGAIF